MDVDWKNYGNCKKKVTEKRIIISLKIYIFIEIT